MGLRSKEEVQKAIRAWLKRTEKAFDPDFDMLVEPDLQDRWKSRVGLPETSRGYHGVSQTSAYYALSLLRANEKTERATRILRRVLEARVYDEASPRYGEFKLIYEALDDDVLDSNTTFFVCFSLLVAAFEYGARLGDELVTEIREACALIPPEKYAGDLSVGYTNARLSMCCVNLAICGWIGDWDRFEVSRRHFNHFYDVNMSRGIPERLSATYYLVDFVALGLIFRYVKDLEIRQKSQRLVTLLLQELFFFGDRQPIPARRTYNQNVGAALHRSSLSWFLGLWTPEDEDEAEKRENSWLALCDVLIRDLADFDSLGLRGPRQMRGLHVDGNGYTSYVHDDFTIGTFDRWPPITVGKQHESDIPVAFSGSRSDLVYLGHYSIDQNDIEQSHPGTGLVATDSWDSPTKVIYESAQEANVACILMNVTGINVRMKEYGALFRGLQYGGTLFDQGGEERTGEGKLEDPWFFLRAKSYLAGIRVLTSFDPTGESLQASREGATYRFQSEGGLDVFAPVFRSENAIDVSGDNLPGGVILVIGSSKWCFEGFREACLGAKVLDEWYVDGYGARRGFRDAERRVGIDIPGASMRLSVDYLTGAVTERSFNGTKIGVPSELSAIRLAVQPWTAGSC